MMEFPKGALDGLVVLDLTRVLCGPYGTMWLGDMGADIIKIETQKAAMIRGLGGGPERATKVRILHISTATSVA